MTERRRSLTELQRIDVLHAHYGRCYLCGGTINLARIKRGEEEPFEVEHAHALGLGGPDKPTNWFPAHVSCHRKKTRKDRRAMAKIARAEKARAGQTKRKQKIASRPFQGGKGGKLRKALNGAVIERDTEKVIREGWNSDRATRHHTD